MNCREEKKKNIYNHQAEAQLGLTVAPKRAPQLPKAVFSVSGCSP